MNMFLEGALELFVNNGYRSEMKMGHPALFLRSSGRAELFEVPTYFLIERYVSSGATPSPRTWQKAAYSLKTWFQYCQALETDWWDASEDDRTNFRDACLGAISPHTCEPYGTKGIRDVMTVVREFYTFARKINRYVGDLGDDSDYGTSQLEASTAEPRPATRQGPKRKDRALPKQSRNEVIHPLRMNDLRTLLNCAGPQATNRQDDLRNCRDRLILDIGVFVGLRVSEMASLTTLQFLNLNPDHSAPYTSLSLTINGKGQKVRHVAIPTWLVIDVIEYIDTERAQALKGAKRRKVSAPSISLFLGHSNSNRGRGQAIGAAAIQKMIERLCFEAGVVEVVEKENPESGDIFQKRVAKHSPHDLRHTFAVLTYHAEVKNGNSEPWKKIQAQLGHTHLNTTIDTYLSHVQLFSDEPGLFSLHRALGLR